MIILKIYIHIIYIYLCCCHTLLLYIEVTICESFYDFLMYALTCYIRLVTVWYNITWFYYHDYYLFGNNLLFDCCFFIYLLIYLHMAPSLLISTGLNIKMKIMCLIGLMIKVSTRYQRYSATCNFCIIFLHINNLIMHQISIIFIFIEHVC